MIVDTSYINDDISLAECLFIAGTEDGGLVVCRCLTEEPYAEAFVGLEGSGMGSDEFGGGWDGQLCSFVRV